jgi:hypothetical protein
VSLVRNVLGIEPDANGVVVALDGDEFGIAVSGKGAKGGDEVELVFAGGEKGVHHVHGNFDFNAGFF